MIPLAEQLRPKQISDIVGQNHLLDEGGLISLILKRKTPLSIILWGPPGSGKTTIARLYARAFSMRFECISPIFSGITDLKKILKESDETPLFGQTVLLFVDEIHRFNKAQQDAFLPYLENGKLILVGATAENPSFYLNDALLSRVRVLQLNSLDHNCLEILLQRYELLKGSLNLSKEARQYILELAQGDGRYFYNLIENIQDIKKINPLSIADLEQILQKRAPLFDKGGEQHYNLISALHKSIRGSDPDASLYWYCRMLVGGEEPLFIARRLIRMASEDIGLADPQALVLAIAARDTYQMLGSPEGELALAEVVVYLALSPKSNSIYTAYNAARIQAAETSHLPPPSIILNAPTKLMKQIGYGKGYQYDHDTIDGVSGQNYFPKELTNHTYFTPQERGFERELKKRMDYFNKIRKENSETSHHLPSP